MLSPILDTYSNENWHFLNIPDKELKKSFTWINIYFPKVDMRFPWAFRDDILRLFFICSDSEKEKVTDFFKFELGLNLEPIHLQLIDFFSHSPNFQTEDLDALIEKSEDDLLLNFIYETLERSLMWQWLDPCWPSDFHGILSICRTQINSLTSATFEYKESSQPEGVYFVSVEEHTHVFYKFKELCSQLGSGQISYNIKTLAIQAHEALIKSIRLRLEFNISELNEIEFDKKTDSIIKKETDWCISRITEKTKA